MTQNDDLIALAHLGSEMRHAQKEYFRTRSSTALARSKTLERRFDKRCLDVIQQQKELF